MIRIELVAEVKTWTPELQKVISDLGFEHIERLSISREGDSPHAVKIPLNVFTDHLLLVLQAVAKSDLPFVAATSDVPVDANIDTSGGDEPPEVDDETRALWGKLDVRILDAELSPRTKNALINQGWHYVGCVVTKRIRVNDEPLSRGEYVPNFGPVCRSELEKYLATQGLHVGMEESELKGWQRPKG